MLTLQANNIFQYNLYFLLNEYHEDVYILSVVEKSFVSCDGCFCLYGETDCPELVLSECNVLLHNFVNACSVFARNTSPGKYQCSIIIQSSKKSASMIMKKEKFIKFKKKNHL